MLLDGGAQLSCLDALFQFIGELNHLVEYLDINVTRLAVAELLVDEFIDDG